MPLLRSAVRRGALGLNVGIIRLRSRQGEAAAALPASGGGRDGSLLVCRFLP